MQWTQYVSVYRISRYFIRRMYLIKSVYSQCQFGAWLSKRNLISHFRPAKLFIKLPRKWLCHQLALQVNVWNSYAIVHNCWMCWQTLALSREIDERMTSQSTWMTAEHDVNTVAALHKGPSGIENKLTVWIFCGCKMINYVENRIAEWFCFKRGQCTSNTLTRKVVWFLRKYCLYLNAEHDPKQLWFCSKLRKLQNLFLTVNFSSANPLFSESVFTIPYFFYFALNCKVNKYLLIHRQPFLA